MVALFLENGADPDPLYNPTFQSKSQFESWEVLFSSSVSPRRYRTPKTQNAPPERFASNEPGIWITCSEAARHIWSSRVQEYDDEQVLIFLDHLIYEHSTHFRNLWRKGEATPFLWALRGGHFDLVTRLLKAGVSREVLKSGTDILEEAVKSGNTHIAELLLDELVDPSVANSQVSSLVLHAAATGDIAMMKMLFLRPGISRQVADLAFFRAISGGHIKGVNFLLKKGVNPHTVTEHSTSRTPLHVAVLREDLSIVRLLLKKQIAFDAKDEHGRTPLFYAVHRGQGSIAQLLLQHGADPNTTESGCKKPILYNDRLGSQTIPELRFRNNQKKVGGQTPLFFAAGTGHESMVELLLDYGAKPDHQDEFGERPILWAAARGFEPIVKMLIDKGGNVNCSDDSNQSLLLWALGQGEMGLMQKIARGEGDGVRRGHVIGDMEAVVNLLLHHGADPNTADGKGRGPINLLVECRYDSKSLVKLLLKAGSDPNKKDKYGRTPLMGATVRGKGNIVAALLEAPDIDRDATDLFGRTALMEAMSRNQPRITKLLSQDRGEDLACDSSDDGDEFEDDGDVMCDICGASTGDQFDICEECRRCGATCLDDTHRLAKRQKR
ncbi:uncharacterized protein CDV56_109435 [Aspergillus thermomutatus]|uniref:Uncharacterized protein n=1 Tax=Aspergillus thermomutatus TaxID=41047 RepID=A0A397HUA3_ASPTH|nr:uncharacterized protein CDV56_109435 [Aspergillus thermomutatus]RHZ65538.1 hypothetical protein CDV56_109435 [Aspergillus thermomutatus]